MSARFPDLIFLRDFLEFIASLNSNPFQGDELCPNIRSIRMAIISKGRGKSGDVFLLEIYDKADFSTVDPEVLQAIVEELGLQE